MIPGPAKSDRKWRDLVGPMLCIPPAQLKKKMGTEGENTEGFTFTSLPEHLPEVHGRDLPPSDEADLIDRFQNVGLYPHYGGGGGSDSSATATASLLPLRPYTVDCAFYLKTGACKFGAQCRYNHPLNRDASAVKDIEWKNQDKSTHRVQCKYQFSPGGCKFGSLCRYSHSAVGSDSAAPALNFVGLPKREGEKECPYFMRYGSCSYGANCVYHHPEPSSIGKDKSTRKTFAPLHCESALLQLSDAARNHQAAPWLSSPLSRSPLSFRDGYSHPTIVNSLRRPEYPEPNLYQASQFPCQRIPVHLIPGSMRLDNLPPLAYGAVEQYPERPGQPECAYFMKTGDCKFKVACRYHHPKYQHECLLSEKGLPLRPGRNICRHFQSFGVCKFGRACLFDHPISHDPSNVQKWFYPEPAPAHDGGS